EKGKEAGPDVRVARGDADLERADQEEDGQAQNAQGQEQFPGQAGAPGSPGPGDGLPSPGHRSRRHIATRHAFRWGATVRAHWIRPISFSTASTRRFSSAR